MKNRLMTAVVYIILCVLLAIPAGALTLEQVQASPPQFDVYIYGDGEDLSSVTAENVSAKLGETALQCEDVSRSEQGIFYIFMLDISGSIPADYFEAAKSAVLNTCDELREQDKLAVITFGSSVNVILTGDEDDGDVRAALSDLEARDSKTMFYTAMDKLIETATKTSDMRRVAVVMSDGVDDSDAGMTQAELEDKLKNSGISVYALCIDTSGMTQAFGDFIRLSGGELYTFNPDNAVDVLDELLTRLSDSLCIRLVTYDEVATGTQTLMVDLGQLGSVSSELTSDKWVADSTAPYITAVLYSLENQTLDISFSEPVLGVEELSAYKLSSVDGNEVALSGASYTGEGRLSVSLSFAELPVEGQYTLSVSGITDMSANANPLHEYSKPVMLATGVQPDENEPGVGSWHRTMIYAVVAVVAIGLIALLGWLIVRLNKINEKIGKNTKLSETDKQKIKKAGRSASNERRFIFTNAVKNEEKAAVESKPSSGKDEAGE